MDDLEQRYIRPKRLATRWDVTESALAQWRHRKQGPRYIVLPGTRTVLYDLEDIRRIEADRGLVK